eukprot:CAMPEP_0197425512 /NCGR_PEP_ID=MMETSP1170-20131217/31116_1 /TAXON_ID=54406 /ORGANISM="Sarcinochrysis sp, Strain CCMP770" /LENGTH=52 /DNA_ID=CAMNT_0042953073 /DNA_START=248 /DNA_END=402 /DNA_ORIENTATION=-
MIEEAPPAPEAEEEEEELGAGPGDEWLGGGVGLEAFGHVGLSSALATPVALR